MEESVNLCDTKDIEYAMQAVPHRPRLEYKDVYQARIEAPPRNSEHNEHSAPVVQPHIRAADVPPFLLSLQPARARGRTTSGVILRRNGSSCKHAN